MDITMLANQNEEVRGSINNIKETRLNILLESKPVCERYFYYNRETKILRLKIQRFSIT